MSLLDVIVRFRTPGLATADGLYQVTRTLAGDHATGQYVPGSTSTFNVTASVQPFSGRETVVLPEGVRTEDVRVLWTATELRVHDDDTDPDVVQIPGRLAAPTESFYVFKVDGPWTMSGRTHYRAYVARKKKP